MTHIAVERPENYIHFDITTICDNLLCLAWLWYKARNRKDPVRIELTCNNLPVSLVNYMRHLPNKIKLNLHLVQDGKYWDTL